MPNLIVTQELKCFLGISSDFKLKSQLLILKKAQNDIMPQFIVK